MPRIATLRAQLLFASTVLATFLSSVVSTHADTNPIVAIDIVLTPDATMREHAQAANADLLKDYPRGFVLDENHNPHITLLQTYVEAKNLEKVYEAADGVVRKEQPSKWKLDAFKYYYGKMGETGLAGIVARTTPDMLRTQKELIDAVAPYSVAPGSSDLDKAFVTMKGEAEVDQFTKKFVGEYVERAAGDKFNPHVTTGIGTVPYLDKLLAEPFQPFSFAPSGVTVYQLGIYGTARKVLKKLE